MSTYPKLILSHFGKLSIKNTFFTTSNIETITILSEADFINLLIVAILMLHLDILFLGYKINIEGPCFSMSTSIYHKAAICHALDTISCICFYSFVQSIGMIQISSFSRPFKLALSFVLHLPMLNSNTCLVSTMYFRAVFLDASPILL